ncbi:MAG: carbamoyltransferase HypF, partial [Actinomycetota bacterium]
EGQAAIEWEQAADTTETFAFPCSVTEQDGFIVIDGVELVYWSTEELRRGSPLSRVAAGFHNGLAGALVHACLLVRDRWGLNEVALSGGTFQNLLLSERVTAGLEAAGFAVHLHSRVPANDGGISLGQAAAAAARMRAG